jgi:hypothetical protein
MTKQIDLDKPLSDEDRAWLKERSQMDLIAANDRQFGKDEPEVEETEGGGQVLQTTGAPQSWDPPESEPKHEFVNRPYDQPVSGHFAPEASAEEPAEEDDIEYWTVEELKEELRAHGESTSGNKEELVKRLRKVAK